MGFQYRTSRHALLAGGRPSEREDVASDGLFPSCSVVALSERKKENDAPTHAFAVGS